MMELLIKTLSDDRNFEYDFVLTPGVIMTSNLFMIDNNNQSFGVSIPETGPQRDVAVKLNKLVDDCIATVNIKGEGIYQFIVNKKAKVDLIKALDANTYYRFKSILETAYTIACKDNFQTTTQNTQIKF